MDHLSCLLLEIMLLVLNFGLQHCQDTDVPLAPLNLKIHIVSTQQRLDVEWNVSGHAIESGSNIEFNIQVSRGKAMNIICDKKITERLSQTNKWFRWSWVSDLPLECESHSVRIRSSHVRDQVIKHEEWSLWSPWKTHYGEKNMGQKPIIYPDEKTVHEGSTVTFCCIPGQNQKVTMIRYAETSHTPPATPESKIFTVTVKNVSLSKADGFNVVCFSGALYYGTVLIVSHTPDRPDDISCETHDLKTLKCHWLPGNTYNFDMAGNGDGKLSPKYMLHDRLSRNSSSCQTRDSCTWSIERDTPIYNFTLMAENQLGSSSVDFAVNITNSIRPFAPTHLFAYNMDSRNATLSWLLEADYKSLPLTCQVGLWMDSEDEQLVKTSVTGEEASSPYSVSLDALKPYTSYTLRVRCTVTSVAKWSKWSQKITIKTPEDVPTASLDIWREVNDAHRVRTVTLHWRPLSGFDANGHIYSYHVTWLPLGRHSEAQHRNISALQNRTQITLDSQAYIIRITAQNRAGSSPVSELRISATSKNGTEEIEEKRMHGKDGAICLSWTPRPNIYHGYVVEWCNYPWTFYCDLEWKKFNSSIHKAVIKSSAFKPGVRYRFRIYGSTDQGEHLLERRVGYTRELAPSIMPRLRIDYLEPYSLDLNWEQYTIDESQEGFITGYKIYIKTPERICELKNVEEGILSDGSRVCLILIKDPERKSFTINNLKPNTKYEVGAAAVTEGGESAFEFIETETPSDTRAVILAIVLSVVIFSIIAFILLTMGYCNRSRLKNMFYPDIPDPNKSNILSFDTIKSNANMDAMLAPNSGQSQNIDIIKVQEPKLREKPENEPYQRLDAGYTDPNENKPSGQPIDSMNTSDSLYNIAHEHPLGEKNQEESYHAQPTNYMEFFNQNYCENSEDTLDPPINLGYKPQTTVSHHGLQWTDHCIGPKNRISTNLNTEPDLMWRDASLDNLYSMDLGEMSPISTKSSAFMLKD
ncbi:oncostatin-M-specific receptor subunit beta [Pelodytes ibericus]